MKIKPNKGVQRTLHKVSGPLTPDVGARNIMKNTFKTFILLPAFLCVLANAQTNAPSSDDYGPKTYKFTLENLPLDMLLEHYYCSISGDKTEIAPGVAESFTFASGQRLTRDEAIAYITKELEKKHIHLVRQENGILRAEWIP